MTSSVTEMSTAAQPYPASHDVMIEEKPAPGVAYPSTAPSTYPPLDADLLARTQPQVRIFLKPIAQPSCLGFAGFFGSTWIVSTYLTAWYGTANTPTIIFPFVAFFGGLGQFIAGLFGFPARDNMATVIHVTWGSFFMGYGLLFFLKALGYYPGLPGTYDHNSELATWFVVLAAITWCVCLASVGRDFVIFLVSFFLALGSTLLFAGWYSDGDNCRRTVKAGGYSLILASLCALYHVLWTLLGEAVLENSYSWLPVLKSPWEKARKPVRIPVNEPGVKKGQ